MEKLEHIKGKRPYLHRSILLEVTEKITNTAEEGPLWFLFPLMQLKLPCGDSLSISCCSSVACLSTLETSHGHAVQTQPRATGLEGQRGSHVSSAPPVPLKLAAHNKKLTVPLSSLLHKSSFLHISGWYPEL